MLGCSATDRRRQGKMQGDYSRGFSRNARNEVIRYDRSGKNRKLRSKNDMI